MGMLTVRNLDEDIKQRLRTRAAANGRSMEEEVRQILRLVIDESWEPGSPPSGKAFVGIKDARDGAYSPEPAPASRLPKKRSFAEILALMPDVGEDEDFARKQDAEPADGVFD